MGGERLRYSDMMARRIQCLRRGSFECLMTGGVYSEEDAAAILPYLDVSYRGTGYRIAAVRSAPDTESLLPARCDNAPVQFTAAKVLGRKVGRRGFVQQRVGDVLALLWCASDGGRGHELVDLLQETSTELRSRYRIGLSCGIGGWRHRLTDAPLSYREATDALARALTAGLIVVDAGQPAASGEPSDGSLCSLELETRGNGDVCETEPARSIQAYIRDNYLDPGLSLTKVAERFGLAETYLSQVFKEQTGVNYSSYLENLRIAEARRLLAETGMSVSRAAARVGYQINSTFYRAFKRALGMSPSLYRRKAIETSGEGVIGTLHSPDIQPAAQHARAM